MSFTINAFNHEEWKRLGLADFADFADQITECNVGEDSFSGFGEWFFVPDEPLASGDRVIYFGSWGNDNSPGASSYTHAEIFDGTDPDELAEFTLRVQEWEGKPEARRPTLSFRKSNASARIDWRAPRCGPSPFTINTPMEKA